MTAASGGGGGKSPLSALRQAVRELEERPDAGLEGPGRERRRRRLADLRSALRFVEETLPKLPVCHACGKACHPSSAEAAVHLRVLELADELAGKRPQAMCAYRCLLSSSALYHVGHKSARRS